jgi:nucleotide-binding universal stress UspA family protein
MLPADFSEPFYEALETAKEMASRFAADLFLIHVVPTLPPFAPAPEDKPVFNVAAYVQNLQFSAEKSLEEVIDKKIGSELKTHIKVAHGDVAEKIARQAQKEKIDLIIISSHGTKGRKKCILGSVTEKLTRISPVPILIVRDSLERNG